MKYIKKYGINESINTDEYRKEDNWKEYEGKLYYMPLVYRNKEFINDIVIPVLTYPFLRFGNLSIEIASFKSKYLSQLNTTFSGDVKENELHILIEFQQKKIETKFIDYIDNANVKFIINKILDFYDQIKGELNEYGLKKSTIVEKIENIINLSLDDDIVKYVDIQENFNLLNIKLKIKNYNGFNYKEFSKINDEVYPLCSRIESYLKLENKSVFIESDIINLTFN
jgi:hypothetical protein